MFAREKIKTKCLKERESKTDIKISAINPDNNSYKLEDKRVDLIADAILEAKSAGKPVIMAFGAHLVKNCLGLVVRRMIEKGYLTHLATNGAGSIHDWEFAFQGKSEEDVRRYISQGQFGIWEETGGNINKALISGAAEGKGYGESVAEMIHTDKFTKHPFKQYSIQDACSAYKIPFTVHLGIGYDITHTYPECDFAALGKTSGVDFLKFVDSVSNLNGGVYLSVGSSIMAPMVFEKALSMARNVSIQEGRNINDFMIVVNDIQDGNWDWGSGKEPDKDDPAYYLRFCKSFDRMGAREMHYVEADNRKFLCSLYNSLERKRSEK
ncbi:MAG: hypothetical protein Q8Q31_04225 [Nanoarchaeota archaeon]|nr:hypothetical protein [Nanoarchaeota archaeon]